MSTGMEVGVSSSETIGPADSDQVHLLKPFKLSFLDQLIPAYYAPLIFFYPKSTASDHHHPTQISSHLKKSLSKTLNHFYPLAGRPKHNFSVDSYEEGVPYIEARVNGGLSDYLDAAGIENLNQLLPVEPFRHLSDSHPLVAVQFNMFDCGGIALALCCSHKIVDLSSVSAFLKTWTSFSQGSDAETRPRLLEASSRFFPPRDRISPDTLSPLQQLWFREGNYKTGNFVFDANAVKALMLKARSKNLERPSRAETLTAFIWKHAMLASRSTTGTVKPSVARQAVDLRRKMKPRLPDYSFGNMIWFTTSTYYNPAEKDIELHELASLLRQSVENFNIEALQSDEGFDIIKKQINQASEFAINGTVDFYGFSNCLNFGLHQHDFGWGKPKSVCIPGTVAPALNNCIFLKDIGDGKAIEAWVTLDQKCMDMLQHDPDFLAFTSPNPSIHKVKI